MNVAVLLIGYVVCVLAASLLGGILPLLIRLTHARMQIMLSLVAGLMLGVGVFHLLPHAVAHGAISIDRAAWWMMLGLLFMFFLQRVFSFHTHEVPGEDGVEVEPTHDHSHDHDHAHDHAHDHDHSHDHDHAAPSHAHSHSHGHSHGHALSWGGVAFGLSIHTIIDGLILAGSVASEAHEDTAGGFGLFGLGTFLVVVLHKPFDAMSISSLMARGGWSVKARHIVNACFAMMVPIGIGLFFLGQSAFQIEQQAFVGCVLAFAAGNFLCISLSDLLPELQFHHHDRLKLSAALLLGIAMAYGLVFLESHGHEHHEPKKVEQGHEGHDHDGHDHAH